MTSLIGRRLGRYEIRAELGRGGMARVYRAVDLQLQRQVALKVLAAQLSLDEEFVRRFEREAATAANLQHPAIVTIYDVGEQEGLYYIAMECVEGRSLHYILEEQTTLGLGYAISLLDPVARALDYAHEQSAVHRDIKPHNILVDRDGRVLLTDFGIAQTPDSDGERLTRTGVFMGTPEYISPEQAEARRVDGRSDLYSLAVVAYEVITGRVPFAGPTPQLIMAHSQLPPPPPTSVLAHLPGELDDVLARALAKRAERRYPTGGALVDALRAVASRYGIPAATREQIAGLAEAAGGAPAPRIPAPIPPLPARPRPQAPPPAQPRPAPSPAPDTASSAGQPTTRARGPVAPPAPVPRPQPAPRPQPTNGATRPQGAPSRPLRSADANASPISLLIIGGLLVAVTVALLMAVAQGLASPGRPFPTPTPPPPSASPTLAVPTAPPTAEAPGLVTTMIAASPTATTPPPTAAPPARPEPTVFIPAPPTLAPAPPSAAPQPPSPTAAELPTAEPPSATPEPPTATETPTLEPTATETPTLEPTAPEQTPILNNTPVVQTPIIPPATP